MTADKKPIREHADQLQQPGRVRECTPEELEREVAADRLKKTGGLSCGEDPTAFDRVVAETISGLRPNLFRDMEIRELALQHAVDIYRGSNIDAKRVLEAAGHFEGYLRHTSEHGEGIPAGAIKREELVDGLDRNPNRETMSSEFNKWAEDRKFDAKLDVPFQPTEHDKS